jgi:hypothetical protein
MQTQFEALTPYENFLFALKAKESKRQYPHRLDKFLTYMEFEGSIEEKCTKLFEFSKNNFYQYKIIFQGSSQTFYFFSISVKHVLFLKT